MLCPGDWLLCVSRSSDFCCCDISTRIPTKCLDADSLLVCVDPMTFDKTRLVQQVGQLESELFSQSQEILQRYLEL